jgi:hypothetical protein
MKTACEISLKVSSHPRPCRASPLFARMVADSSEVGNQPWTGDAERPVSGNQSARSKDRSWPIVLKNSLSVQRQFFSFMEMQPKS